MWNIQEMVEILTKHTFEKKYTFLQVIIFSEIVIALKGVN